MDRAPHLPFLDESLPAEDDATRVVSRRRSLAVAISDPVSITPTVLDSDTDAEVIGDLIDNVGNVDNLGNHDCDDRLDYWQIDERMNGGSVDVAARSRSPTPCPEPGTIRRLGPVPDVLAYHSRVTATSWAAAGVGEAFREAVTRAPLSAAVPFQISPGMTVRLCPPGGDVREHALDQVRAICRAGWTYYVGITENPSRRWAQHREQNAHWDEMRVVVMAETSKDTALVERFILFHCNSGLRCMNVGPGGEHASSGSPHFAYVIYSWSGLIRRSRRR